MLSQVPLQVIFFFYFQLVACKTLKNMYGALIYILSISDIMKKASILSVGD